LNVRMHATQRTTQQSTKTLKDARRKSLREISPSLAASPVARTFDATRQLNIFGKNGDSLCALKTLFVLLVGNNGEPLRTQEKE